MPQPPLPACHRQALAPCKSHRHAGHSHAEQSMQHWRGLGGALPATDVSSGRGSMAGKKGGEQRCQSACPAEGPGATGWWHSQGWPGRTTEAGSILSSHGRAQCSGGDGEIVACMAATHCPPKPITKPPAPGTQQPPPLGCRVGGSSLREPSSAPVGAALVPDTVFPQPGDHW